MVQNLHIMSFPGISRNAVITQIWIALCAYLLLAFQKFQLKLESMQQILRLLQLNLFDRRDSLELFAPLKQKSSLSDKQLSLI